MAGAFAYLSHATTSTPKRISSIATSFPNSPLPSNNALRRTGVNTEPIFVIMVVVNDYGVIVLFLSFHAIGLDFIVNFDVGKFKPIVALCINRFKYQSKYQSQYSQ